MSRSRLLSMQKKFSSWMEKYYSFTFIEDFDALKFPVILNVVFGDYLLIDLYYIEFI